MRQEAEIPSNSYFSYGESDRRGQAVIAMPYEHQLASVSPFRDYSWIRGRWSENTPAIEAAAQAASGEPSGPVAFSSPFYG